MLDNTGFQRADRIAAIEISEMAANLRTEGRDIVTLSTGVPDLPMPPSAIAEPAHRADWTR